MNRAAVKRQAEKPLTQDGVEGASMATGEFVETNVKKLKRKTKVANQLSAAPPAVVAPVSNNSVSSNIPAKLPTQTAAVKRMGDDTLTQGGVEGASTTDVKKLKRRKTEAAKQLSAAPSAVVAPIKSLYGHTAAIIPTKPLFAVATPDSANAPYPGTAFPGFAGATAFPGFGAAHFGAEALPSTFGGVGHAVAARAPVTPLVCPSRLPAAPNDAFRAGAGFGLALLSTPSLVASPPPRFTAALSGVRVDAAGVLGEGSLATAATPTVPAWNFNSSTITPHPGNLRPQVLYPQLPGTCSELLVAGIELIFYS